MQGFYISNLHNKMHKLAFFEKWLREYKLTERDGISLRLFYNENHKSIIELKDNFAANIGVFIYKNKWNRDALCLFLEDLNNGFDLIELLQNTHGQFCLLLYYKNEFHLITDKVGTIPIFAYVKNNIVEISNIWLPLAKNNAVSLNYQWMAHYISHIASSNNSCYDKTLASEISILNYASIYSIGKKLTSKKYYDFKKDLIFSRYDDLEDIVNVAQKIISDNFAFLKNTNGITCNITGGFDTRTNLAVLLHNNIQFSSGIELPIGHNSLLTKGKYSDLVISKKIAEHFNLNFDIYTEKKTKTDEIKQKKYSDLNYLLFETRYISTRMDYLFDAAKKHKIMITGIFGSEIVNQCFHELQGYRDFDANLFVRQSYSYIDIIKNKYISGREYHDKQAAMLNNILADSSYQKTEDIATYLSYFAFYRTDFSRAFGAYNCAIPTYSPYLEADFVKFSMEVPFKLKGRHSIQRIIII